MNKLEHPSDLDFTVKYSSNYVGKRIYIEDKYYYELPDSLILLSVHIPKKKYELTYHVVGKILETSNYIYYEKSTFYTGNFSIFTSRTTIKISNTINDLYTMIPKKICDVIKLTKVLNNYNECVDVLTKNNYLIKNVVNMVSDYII